MVRELSGEPTLFSAIPPDRLLQQLEDVFDRRLAEAKKESVQRLAATDLPPSLEYVEQPRRRGVIKAAWLGHADSSALLSALYAVPSLTSAIFAGASAPPICWLVAAEP